MLSTASKPRVASLSISVLFSVNVQLKIDLQKKVKKRKFESGKYLPSCQFNTQKRNPLSDYIF